MIYQYKDSAGSYHTELHFDDGTQVETGYSLTKLGAWYHRRRARHLAKNDYPWRAGPGWNGKRHEMLIREEEV